MNAILNERLRQSMSQKRLAALANIDARTLRKIEKGVDVSASTKRNVCLALGLDPSTPISKHSALQASSSPIEKVHVIHLKWFPKFLTGKIIRIPSPTLVMFCALFLLASYSLGAIIYHNSSNAQIVISYQRTCAPDDKETGRAKVASIFNEDRLVESVSLRPGTASCEIVVPVATKYEESRILAQLSANGLTGHVEQWRARQNFF